MTKNLISIVVPIYKVEKYLDKCVNSIVNQTYRNLEIILVDDGSPDNCPQMCDNWAKKDNRIKVIHKENGGLSDARNAGIDIATGEYITFVDSDDYIDITYCEILLENLLKTNSDFAICDFRSVGENDIVSSFNETYDVGVHNGDNLLKIFTEEHYGNIISAWAKLYKKSIFSDIRYPKGKIYEDLFTIPSILLKSKRCVCINAKLYMYLARATGITGLNFSEKNLAIIDATENLINTYLHNAPQYIDCDNGIGFYVCRNIRQAFNTAIYRKADKKILLLLREEFKKCYKLTAKHSKKDFFFMHMPNLSIFLAKIRFSILKKK